MAMLAPREYLAAIGRRGGIKSRRSLDAGTARQMVAKREARRAARNAAEATVRLSGTPADTTVAAQAVQDELLRRATPAEKLTHVANLSRMVDQLSVQGLRLRHPTADEATIGRLRGDP